MSTNYLKETSDPYRTSAQKQYPYAEKKYTEYEPQGVRFTHYDIYHSPEKVQKLTVSSDKSNNGVLFGIMPGHQNGFFGHLARKYGQEMTLPLDQKSQQYHDDHDQLLQNELNMKINKSPSIEVNTKSESRVHVPVVGLNRQLSSIQEDLEALGISTRDHNFARKHDLKDVGRILKEGTDNSISFEKRPLPIKEAYIPTPVKAPQKISSLQEDFRNMGLSSIETKKLSKKNLLEERAVLEDASYYRDNGENNSSLQLNKEPEEYRHEGSPEIHKYSEYSFNVPHNFGGMPKVTHLSVLTSYHPKNKTVETTINGRSMGKNYKDVEPLHQEIYSGTEGDIYHNDHNLLLKDLGLNVEKKPEDRTRVHSLKAFEAKEDDPSILNKLDFKALGYNSYEAPKFNPQKKNSLQQTDGADSANKSRRYPVPSIDKHSNEWQELDTQRSIEEALRQRFVEQTLSGNVGGYTAPFGPILRGVPSHDIYPEFLKHKPKKKKKNN